jgi:hypothetical protein
MAAAAEARAEADAVPGVGAVAGVGDDDDPGHVRAVADLMGRIRTIDATEVGHRHGRSGVVLVERPQAPPAELDRGDMGEGRVGQTLEGARIHGLEVLHGVDLAAGVAPVDHLVVAVNGLWIVHAVDVLRGPLERRDLGDWFTADPRLHIAGEDRSDLVATVADQVAAAVGLLAPTRHADLPVRGVVCFGSAPAGWVDAPFAIDDVWVTWRNHLVEPMLEPVLIDPAGRDEVTTLLAGDRRGR